MEKAAAELRRLEWQQPVARIDRQLEDLLRRRRRHFLDVDAARGAHHEDGPLCSAVDDDPDICLGRNVSSGRDEHLVHRQSLDLHAEDPRGDRSRLVRRLREDP